MKSGFPGKKNKISVIFPGKKSNKIPGNNPWYAYKEIMLNTVMQQGCDLLLIFVMFCSSIILL